MTQAYGDGRAAPFAFSLNLGPEIEAKAMAKPAKAKSFMHERLDRAFERHLPFPVDFAFVLEFSETGRLHLHGIVYVDAHWKEAAAQALVQAGGRWDAKHSEFQADVRRVWSGYGWATYCDKQASTTKRILGLKSVLSCTRSLQQQAQKHWDGLRAQEKVARRAGA